jgi:DNA-binding MarR family transcriptional regulator
MLKSLEQLGLIVRKPCEWDRRQRLVELTEAGLRLMQKAHDELVASGAGQLALDCALAFHQSHDRRVTSAATEMLDWLLARMRLQFRDYAWLAYEKQPAWLREDAPGARTLKIPIKYRLA